MKARTLILVLAVIFAGRLFPSHSVHAAEPQAPAAITEKVRFMQGLPGFLPLYWDAKAGRMWLEISRFDSDFLYVDSLPAGLGSNDIGLDRGQLGRERVVRFTRNGPRILLVEQNLAFRAERGSPAEKRAVQESFAQSVVAGFDVAAEEGSRVLVDATGFFLRDAHDVVGGLKRAKQGSYSLDLGRSAFALASTKNFPRNTEVEVTLTFAGAEPGDWVKDVAPDPTSLTVRTRHSLIELPGPGYLPRAFDPRAGYFPVGYADYSAPLGEPLLRQFITRHRLQKKDPTAARSEAVVPILYYLDPATPEPVRGALLDGARWWSQAFEAAGFLNAFRVEMLPADADPLDVRYNVIQWVHRATRGWSYGMTVTDPRTGEILKGHVTLGSLRVRQDYLIAEGLLAPYETGRPTSPVMEKMALARLRQLAAHEVGHTLGLAHNYIASTQNRASVMDYPHPRATLRADGKIDLADAYAVGIGEWDKVAITYGYAQFSAGADESGALAGVLDSARTRGLIFLTDKDGRPLGSPHPQVHLWDNGINAVDELQRLLTVRAAALSRLGENAIKPGRPLATIEEVLVPVYLMHRYQLEAAAKSIAGISYTYALRGDGQVPLTPLAPAEQRRALTTLLAALAPETLRVPEPLRQLIAPRPAGFERHRELFANHTAETFDAMAPAEAAATLTFDAILEPGRCARLVEQAARDAKMPGLDEVIETLLKATWMKPAGANDLGELQRTVNFVALVRLLDLAANNGATLQVRAVTTARLTALRKSLLATAKHVSVPAQRAHLHYGARMIGQFLEHPADFAPPKLPPPPPGSPIGCDF